MELTSPVDVEDVKASLVETLDLDHVVARGLGTTTPLLGALAELDSMAVLELLVDLERRFEIEIDGEEVTADVFETLGTLTSFVRSQLP